MTPVRLDPAAPRSRVKHSTTGLPMIEKSNKIMIQVIAIVLTEELTRLATLNVKGLVISAGM